MAIVYSYPLNENIKSLDELVGTTEQNINGQLKTVTRNFLLGDLAEFFIVDGGLQKEITLTTNFTSGPATLDQVTGILNIPNYSESIVGTNLSPTQTDINFTINSSTGTGATIPLGNGLLAGATLNDYTTTEKTKLAGIAPGAEVNVNADWNATSGDALILNKPVIPSTAGFLPLAGGNMTGTINWFSQTGAGLNWDTFTDGASIRFYSASDSDPDTRLEFNIRDNQTEYFRWTAQPSTPVPGPIYEIMRLSPTTLGSGNAILNISGKVIANSFEKLGGTNVQILAANGSVITAGTNITISGGTISSTGGSGSQNLQQVTDIGATTTKGITITVGDGGGDGIHSFSSQGYGVYGSSSETYGVYGTSTSAAGVYGISGSYGVHGYSESIGVYGDSTNLGVQGNSFAGTGMYASSDSGTGLYSYSESGIGISAYSNSIGLEVNGNGTIAIQANLGNSNKGLVINSGTSSTGNFIELSKNGVDKLTINQQGELSIVKIPGGTSSQILAADGSIITAGANVTISGGTISATGGGGGGGSIPHATASGTDTYTATIAGITSYSDGDAYLIRFAIGNTTVATLNINGLGAIPLYRNNDGALIGGDVQSNGEMLCVYNSTANTFQCIGTSPNSIISYVTNAESLTITKGQVVYAFGGTGDRMTVKLASNIGDSTSAQTVGIVLSTSIAANQKGFIMFQGLLDNLSVLPTTTWADGDQVYLGATAGSITKVKPYAPNHLVYIGIVTTASSGNAGRMYVRVQNGYELDELHNVQAQNPNNKDTLYYDDTVTPKQWKTSSISGILGYTPANDSAVVHIAGTETITGTKTFTNTLTAAGFSYTSGTIFPYSSDTYYTNGTGRTHSFGGGPGSVINNLAVPLGVLSVGPVYSTTAPNFGAVPNIIAGGWPATSGGVLDLRNTYTPGAGVTCGTIQFTHNDYTSSTITATTTSIPSGGSSGGGNLIFSTSSGSPGGIPFEVMRVSSGGAVGIGLTNPSTILEVYSSANAVKITSGQGTALDIIGGNNSNAIAKFTNVATSVETGRFDITGLKLPLETASTIASFDANKNVKSLSTGTYPTLAELALVKGVSGSSIQTQLNGKQATLVSGSNIKTINGSTILGSGDLIIGGTGITSLNGLNVPTQTFATSTAGSSFAVTSSGSTHTINIPLASYFNTGLIDASSQVIGGSKTFIAQTIIGAGSTITPGYGEASDIIVGKYSTGGVLDLRVTGGYTAGTTTGTIQFSGEDNTYGIYSLASIKTIATTGTTGGNSGGGNILFSTSVGTTGATILERVRITNTGNVTIGTTNDTARLAVYSSTGTGFRVDGGGGFGVIATFVHQPTNVTVAYIDDTGVNLPTQTASTILSLDTSNNIKSLLPVDGYPTLEELKILKGEKDVAEQTLSNTNITHVGTSLPSGTATHSYRWSQLGSLVTVRINLSYTVTGTCSAIIIPFANLPDIPQQPQHPSIYNAVGDVITYGSGSLAPNKSLPVFSTGSGTSAIRIKSIGTPNTYEFAIGRASAAYLNGWAQIQYYVN